MIRLRNAQIASYFWVCLQETFFFWKKLAFAFTDWVKMITLTQSESTPTNPLSAWIEQKSRGRIKWLSAWAKVIFHLPLGVITLLVLRPLDLNWDLHLWLPLFSSIWLGLELYHQHSWARLKTADCESSKSP